MADVDRARYAALSQVVAGAIAQGTPPRPEWLDEIRRAESAHPEWVAGSWAPPPPVPVPAPPAPPPPPPPGTYAAPVPPPPPPAAPPAAAKPLEPGKRVPIELREDGMADTVREVLTVLGARLRIFQASGFLLELQSDPAKDVKYLTRDVQTPRMVPIESVRARLLAAEECTFGREKHDKHGAPETVPCLPPDWLGSSIVKSTNFPGIPPFVGLSQAPTLRSDGALVREQGYDASTGIYLAREVPVNVPETPTREDAQRAVAHLFDLVSDFDFVNEANKAAWLAGVLSATCRQTFSGPAPMVIIDASRRGSGKTLLADIASIITTGETAPRMHFTSDDTEMDKRITSLGLGGESFALIDNIVGKFASAPLDAALTSTSYRGRMLGALKMSQAIPMSIVWFATGNGMVLGNDMARRSIMARLEPTVDHPERRSGPRSGEPWKYPHLVEHAKQHRSAYLSSALTLVKAFICAGRPKLDLQPMGSFEHWSVTIRAALVWAGAADPCATIEQVQEADLQDFECRRAVECWPVADNVEITTAALIEEAAKVQPAFNEMVAPSPKDVTRRMWRNALLEWLPATKGDLPTARDLGYALRKVRNTVCGDYRIMAGDHTLSGTPWRRVRVWANAPTDADPGNPHTQISLVSVK